MGPETVTVKVKDLSVNGYFASTDFIFKKSVIPTFKVANDDSETQDVDESFFLENLISLDEDSVKIFPYNDYINDYNASFNTVKNITNSTNLIVQNSS